MRNEPNKNATRGRGIAPVRDRTEYMRRYQAQRRLAGPQQRSVTPTFGTRDAYLESVGGFYPDRVLERNVGKPYRGGDDHLGYGNVAQNILRSRAQQEQSP